MLMVSMECVSAEGCQFIAGSLCLKETVTWGGNGSGGMRVVASKAGVIYHET